MDDFKGKTETLANMGGPHSFGDKVNSNLLTVYYMPNLMLTTHHKCTFQHPSRQEFFTVCRPVTFEGDTTSE